MPKLKCPVCGKKLNGRSKPSTEKCAICGSVCHYPRCMDVTKLPEKIVEFDFENFPVCRFCDQDIQQKFIRDKKLKRIMKSLHKVFLEGWVEGRYGDHDSDLD